MIFLRLLLVCGMLTASCLPAEERAASDAGRGNFETSYKAGVDAVTEKDWPTAEVMLEAALKSLGDQDHPNKLAAQTLLNKAKGINQKSKEIRDTLRAADEMLKLKQYPEAKQLYEKAAALGADPETVKKGLAAAEAGEKGTPATAEKPAAPTGDYDALLKDGLAKLEKKDFAGAKLAFEAALKLKPNDTTALTGLKEAERGTGATAETPKETPKTAEPLPLPTPVALVREEWDQGAGSNTLWAAELLHLQEGDEKYRKPLKGDFAASIAIEAQMDHRSMIYLDLRADKHGGKKLPVVRGYGSKEGSAPYLMVDKEVAGRGSGQPKQKQITLSFRRTGDRIEFFCDGQKVAETWSIPKDATLWLWCCGKGTMNGAKIEGEK